MSERKQLKDGLVMGNTVTGCLQKSHLKSNFVYFHCESTLSLRVFSSSRPRIKDGDPMIIVLQVAAIGDNRLVVEYVYEKDF